MQVLFSEEFGYDLKSQVEKSTRQVSGKPMQFAVVADPLATSILHPLSSLRSQESVWTTRPCPGTCSHRKF